jgi:Ala-tRNA(Pro) deacylase
MLGAMAGDTYERLITLLDQHGADYHLIAHRPEGRTEAVSALRGHPLSQAAKCIVLRVKVTKKRSRYVLAVVPGDRRVDLEAIKALFGASYAGFAEAQTAERLAGSVAGTVLPFAFSPELELIVEKELLEAPVLFFNAARLETSIALTCADYKRIAEPHVAAIACPSTSLAPQEEPLSHAR